MAEHTQARQNRARLEVVDRMVAARVVIDAMLCGRWLAEPTTLAATTRLLGAATRWAAVAEAEAKAA